MFSNACDHRSGRLTWQRALHIIDRGHPLMRVEEVQ